MFHVFYKILSIFTLINILFFFEMILSLSIVFMILLQKSSEDFVSKNSSGPVARPNLIINLTYILISLFVLNTFALNIAYQKEFKVLIKAEK